MISYPNKTVCDLIQEEKEREKFQIQQQTEFLKKIEQYAENKEIYHTSSNENKLIQILHEWQEQIKDYCEQHNIKVPNSVQEFDHLITQKIIVSGYLSDALICEITQSLSYLMSIGIDKKVITEFFEKHAVKYKGPFGEDNIKFKDPSNKNLLQLKNDFLQFIHNLKLNDAAITQSINLLHNASDTLSLISSLSYAFYSLEYCHTSNHHIDFVQQFAIVHKDGLLGELKLPQNLLITQSETHIKNINNLGPNKEVIFKDNGTSTDIAIIGKYAIPLPKKQSFDRNVWIYLCEESEENLSWDQVYLKEEGKEPSYSKSKDNRKKIKQYKKKFADSCRRLNNIIAKNTNNIKDFIIHSKGIAHINQKYLKKSFL